MSIHVHLHQFEGPLGLLLFLIRKDEMDIFNINIHQITQQYFDYIKKMKEFDLEVAGDFVQMAATLIQIKSQMLLPQYNANGEEVEQEDPRRELISRLLEYQAFQEAGKKLNDRPLLGRDLWTRGERQIILPNTEPEILLEDGGLFTLIGSYRKVIRKMKKTVHRVATNTLSIAGRILQIKDKFIVGSRFVMSSLFTESEHSRLRYQTLITFLSVLELAKLGFISVFQNEDLGDIHIVTTQEIEGNVVERVQEYDSDGSEELAQKIMEQAEYNAELEASQASLAPPQLMDTTEESALVAVLERSSEGDEDDMDLNEEMATDEDILAAEAELSRKEREPSV